MREVKATNCKRCKVQKYLKLKNICLAFLKNICETAP
jgi:hypothetical protein